MASKEEKRKKEEKTAKSVAKKGGKAAAWGAFTNASVTIVILMWILFPFYSWQLQIILNQGRCMGENTKDCGLPYNSKKAPYCPDEHGSCKESITNPDSFTKVIDFFTHTLQQIYEIITGIAWIKAGEAITKMENSVKSGSNTGTASTKPGAKKGKAMKGGGVHSDSRKGIIKNTTHASTYGQAVDLAEKALSSSIGFSSKTAANSKCCDDVLEWDNLKTQAECEDSFSLLKVEPFKSILPKDFGWPYTYLFNAPKINPENGTILKDKSGKVEMTNTRYDPNGSPEESSPKRWVGAWFAKTQSRSWSASRGIWSRIIMLFFPFLHDDLTNVEVELRIQNFIDGLQKQQDALEKKIEKKIAKAQNPTAVPPAAGTAASSQVPSAPPVTDMQGGFLGMGGKESKGSKESKGQDCDVDCLKEVSAKLNEMKGTFEKLFKKFKAKFPYNADGAPTGGKVNVRGKLYETMNKDLNLFAMGQRKAAEASGDNAWEYENTPQGGGSKDNKTGRNRVTSDVDNIYLDFFISATKPPQHGRTQSGTEKKSHWSRFFNPFGGDSRYWMRYLITWYLPMITMIIVTVSIFTGFWFTAFSSVNRYSNFILPLSGGIWLALINMFLQPLSVVSYMLVGATGKNNDSKNCPYDSGVYQMRRNMKDYFFLNLFITLAVIVTHLGGALAASGHTTIGGILSMLFPIYTLIVLAIKLFHWLWNMA